MVSSVEAQPNRYKTDVHAYILLYTYIHFNTTETAVGRIEAKRVLSNLGKPRVNDRVPTTTTVLRAGGRCRSGRIDPRVRTYILPSIFAQQCMRVDASSEGLAGSNLAYSKRLQTDYIVLVWAPTRR